MIVGTGMNWPSGKWKDKTFDGESALFEQWDAFYESNVLLLETWKKELSSETEFVLNEFIPFVGDWCDLDTIPEGMDKTKCPSWQDPKTSGGDPNLQHAKGVGINRKTLGWNAAAATFAYGYGTLATLGCECDASSTGLHWVTHEKTCCLPQTNLLGKISSLAAPGRTTSRL